MSQNLLSTTCIVTAVHDDGTVTCSTPNGSIVVHCTPAWAAEHAACQPGMHLWVHAARPLSSGVWEIGPDSLLVLDPTSLYDVTDVASLLDETGIIPLIGLVRRLTPPVFFPAASKGKLVNTILDLLVENPSDTAQHVMQTAERQLALTMAHLERRGEREAIVASATSFIPLLINGLKQFSTSTISVEPTFASPRLGLIGRIDLLMINPTEPHDRSVVELKSGSAPKGNRARASHHAQVVAYAMLLEQADPRRTGTNMVWYPATDNLPFRDVTVTADDRRNVIHARNRIVMLERMIAQRDITLLNCISGADPGSMPRFMQDDVRHLAMDIATLTSTERAYLRAWLSFIAREQQQQRQDLAKPMWTNTPEERRTRPSAVTDLRLAPDGVDAEHGHLTFVRPRPSDDCSLRKGDIVLAYQVEPDGTADPSRRQLLKSTVRSISGDTLEISLRNKHVDIEALARATTWVVEQDATESGLRDLYGNLGLWLRSAADVRNVLTGSVRPRMLPPQVIQDNRLRETQREIVSKALGAQDWFLIQGPPGTGKTSSIIRALTSALLATDHERVLLLAFTNRAADEICGVIEREHGAEAYLRIGSKDTSGHGRSVHGLGASLNARQLCDLIASTRCVVATIAAMTRNLDVLEHGGFTTTIVDEASQVVEPQIIGLLASTKRFILVGDECQLPAVIMQSQDSLSVDVAPLRHLSLQSLGTSYFARLMECAVSNGWHDAIGRLTEQGRMHERIGTIASDLWYGGTLRPMLHWQTQEEPWLQVDDQLVMDMCHDRAIRIHVPADGVGPQGEASITAAVATRIHEAANASGVEISIGIITPFRTQINAIRASLSPVLRDSITVETVERYQGSERDVIIYSAAVASPADLDSLSSVASTVFGTIDRKLNVAVTRARQQFILIGDTELLLGSSHYAALIRRLTPIPAENIVD